VSGNHPRREPFQVLGTERTTTEQQRGVHGFLVRAYATEYVFSEIYSFLPYLYWRQSKCEVYTDGTLRLLRLIFISEPSYRNKRI